MSERPFVSVIIPVYNVENYVENSLNSVINQTLKNIEIIVVDDGSTDRSPEIVDRIAKTDPRIKVIHSKNGGVSSARNKGLDIAHGWYIGFFDPDDYIEPDMYEKMFDVAEKHKCDVVECGFFNGNDNPANIEREKAGIYNREQALMSVLTIVGGCVCVKLFSSEILSDIRFRVGLSIGEDRLFCADVFDKCSSLVAVEDAFYHYVSREGSAMHSKLSRKILDGFEYFDGLLEKVRGDEEKTKIILQEKAGSLIFYLEQMIVQEADRELIEEVKGRILAMKDFINTMDFVSFKQKVAFKTLFFSPKLYEAMVKTKHLFSRG